MTPTKQGEDEFADGPPRDALHCLAGIFIASAVWGLGCFLLCPSESDLVEQQWISASEYVEAMELERANLKEQLEKTREELDKARRPPLIPLDEPQVYDEISGFKLGDKVKCRLGNVCPEIIIRLEEKDGIVQVRTAYIFDGNQINYQWWPLVMYEKLEQWEGNCDEH